MCGHVGMAFGTTVGIKGGKFFSQALYVDQLRGMDATGVATVDKDNNVQVFKKALAASDFLQTRMGIRAIDEVEKSFIAIGHNRATTVGKSIDVNSHPFEFDNVVGAHNGTILAHKSIFPVDKYPVDSMNLIASINDKGPKSILEKIHSGSYALVLYDKNEECMVFARNSDRPLHILQTDEGILWASEASMLYWIAGRNNMLGKDSVEIQVPEETIITYDCNSLEFKKKVKLSPKAVSHGGSTGYNNTNQATHRGNNITKRNDGIRKGEIEGVPYHAWLTSSETAMAMAVDTEKVEMIPHTYKPFSNAVSGGKDKSKTGRLFCYVHIPEDAALYPSILYNFKEEDYQTCMAEGRLLSGKILGANISNDGNLVSFTVLEGDLQDTKDSLWQAPFFDVMADDWKAGKTLCTALNSYQELHDSGLRKAFILKSTNRKITPDNLDKIDLIKDFGSKKAGQSVIPFRKEGAKEKEKSTSPPDQQYTNPEAPVEGPDGALTPKEFGTYTSRGCCFCSTPITLEDAPLIGWLKGMQWAPVCEDCLKDPAGLETCGVNTDYIYAGCK